MLSVVGDGTYDAGGVGTPIQWAAAPSNHEAAHGILRSYDYKILFSLIMQKCGNVRQSRTCSETERQGYVLGVVVPIADTPTPSTTPIYGLPPYPILMAHMEF